MTNPNQLHYYPSIFFSAILVSSLIPPKNGSLFSMIPAFFQEEISPHDFHDWRSSWALTGSHEPRCDRNCCDQQRSSRNGPTAWKTESGGSVNCGLREKQGWKSRECLKEMEVAYILYNILYIVYTYSYSCIYIYMYVCVCIVSCNHV